MLANVADLVYSPSSSTSSHSPGDFSLTPGAPGPRRANKLRKSPRGGHALAFSFVPDDPLAVAHFPYSFSAPSSPTSTVQYAPTVTSTTPLLRPENAPKRTVSMPSRKLKKEKPTVVSYAHLPSNSDGLKRRATLSFNFRRRKPDRALQPPPLQGDLPPVRASFYHSVHFAYSHFSFHRVRPNSQSAQAIRMKRKTIMKARKMIPYMSQIHSPTTRIPRPSRVHLSKTQSCLRSLCSAGTLTVKSLRLSVAADGPS